MTIFTLYEKKQNLYSDYCQILLANFTNFTQTYFADRTHKWNHDQLNRFLRNESIPSSEFWKSVEPHQQVKDLSWSPSETTRGKRVHIKRFPKGHQVKLFRIVSDTGRTEYIVTNDLSQSDATATK